MSGCLATTFMLANNTRDRDTDREGGKTTLPQLLGRSTTNMLFAGLIVAPYLLLPILALVGRNPLVLFAGLSLPWGLRAIPRFRRLDVASEFPPIFAELRRLQMVFSALL